MGQHDGNYKQIQQKIDSQNRPIGHKLTRFRDILLLKIYKIHALMIDQALR